MLHDGSELLPHTGQILCTSSPYKHNTVLLQVVALSLDVRHDTFSGRQLDTGDFTLGGVWLLGRGDDQTGDDSFALGAVLKQRRAGLDLLFGHSHRAD